MTTSESPSPQQPPALKLLDRFVGNLGGPGEDLDREAHDMHGRMGFEWLSGGFFLQ
jgi:hypothetical protein